MMIVSLLIAFGLFICLGTYFAARRLARRWLRVPGVGTLSKQADESYFATPRARRIAWRLAGPAASYLLVATLAFVMVRANGEAVPTKKLVVLDGGPAPADVRAPPPAGRALAEAAAMPFTTAAAEARGLWGNLAGTSRTELAGPVGIVRAVTDEPRRSGVGLRIILMALAIPPPASGPSAH